MQVRARPPRRAAAQDPGEANAPAGSSCCIIYISSRGELRYAGSHLIEKELWERHKNEFFELARGRRAQARGCSASS
ncbi:hypothetical protein JL720_12774 [Aureococcus anophagefferens]|nr:hypothetical protein JL720_12774 [Aureococcus anophagefferens]